MTGSATADPTRIKISTDPCTKHMTGITAHGFIPFDAPFISEIVPGLWQGGCEDGLVLPVHIKHLVSLYPWERYAAEHELSSETYVRMQDSTGQATAQVPLLAAWVNLCRTSGPVLIYCQAGLNRSSLVTAMALILGGMSADEAIALIREKRSVACLCNPAFEEWLRAQDPAGRTAQRRERIPLTAPACHLWPGGARGYIATAAVNSLARAGICTVGQLTGCTARDLADLRNFGPGRLAEVRRVLTEAGYALREGSS